MNILIIYHLLQYPTRATIKDHLYSFKRYSNQRCYYLNIAVNKIPQYYQSLSFDIILFHTSFLSQRFGGKTFLNLLEKAASIKQTDAVKIALPQDEFIHTDMLCDWVNDFGIDHVFSVAPETEWPKIYATVNPNRVHFHKVLTSYLDRATLARIEKINQSIPQRDIDIGYRAFDAPPWFGRHGLLKVQVAEKVKAAALAKGLHVDISTHHADTLLGDAWYRFLCRCKYVLGVEGGASILDRDGKIKERVEAYQKLHPNASFAEVERNTFAGMDGTLNLKAISPRNLEACATRTCQILVEGTYNGILQPGIHYIELKADFSNLDEVLEIVRQDRLRNEMVERAYQDIVASGQYDYRAFVERILEVVPYSQKGTATTLGTSAFWYLNRFEDQLSWQKVRFIVGLFRLRDWLYQRFPFTKVVIKTIRGQQNN